MVGTAVAPEFLISKSLGDLAAINENFERLSQLAEEDEVPWSRSHSLFANMGGFVIRCNVPERVGQLQETRTDPASSTDAGSRDESSNDREHDGTLRSGTGYPQSQFSSNGKETSDIETSSMTPSLQYSNPYHLSASDLVALRKAGFLTRLPFITTAELNDRNKSDSLVRLIAIVQILWMIIQIIVRAARHLAISQLEIAVAAFAVCAVAIYGLNWEKPKGVQAPYTLLTYRGNIPKAVLETVGKERLTTEHFLDDFIYFLSLHQFSTDRPPGSPIPNHFSPTELISSNAIISQVAGLIVGGMVFGAIHISAWDFIFPTLLERKLWWAASVICTAAPLFCLLILMLIGAIHWLDTPGFHFTAELIIMMPFMLYIVARLFLLVEVFRTLYFLPPSAYVATWAANVPHIA